MKKQSIEKSFIYNGLGFPVEIPSPKFIHVFGEDIPDINSKLLQKKVFRKLIDEKTKFKGAHIKFIRHMMGLTQAELSKLLGQANHSCVSQWEGKGQNPSGMEASTEKLLKILMIPAFRTGSKKYLNKFFRAIFL